MAENQDGQEKTEEPSGKRLADARKKGQVARSRELNTFILMVVGSAFLLMMGNRMVGSLLDLMREGLQMPRERIFDPNMAVLFFRDNVYEALLIVAPLFVVLVIVAIFSSIVMSGWNFSTQAFAPKFSKLNPISGFKRMVGARGLVELVKALLKFFLIGVVAVVLLQWKAQTFITLGYQSLQPALANMGSHVAWFFLALCATLVVVAAADVPYQLWEHKRQLKMTHREVRDERKDTEGNAETKGRIRQMQVEMAQRRMMAKVPEADVIITNPTHYAVALRYEQGKMGAPRVVAKGKDLVAARIRGIAAEHNVPLLSSPALARAIYHSTELDQEIPAGLYKAVAQVLAYIYQLRDTVGGKFSRPLSMTDVPIPDEYRRDE